MKIIKLVTNPIHAGDVYIDSDVAELGEVSSSTEKALRDYEACGAIRIERKAQTKQRIEEANGVVEETKIEEPPKKRYSRKSSKASSDGE